MTAAGPIDASAALDMVLEEPTGFDGFDVNDDTSEPAPSTAVAHLPSVRSTRRQPTVRQCPYPHDASIPDSQPCEAKFLGIYPIRTNSRPRPEACVDAIQTLASKRSREPYRYGIAKHVELYVSCANGCLLARPLHNPSADDDSSSRDKALRTPLFQIITVKDHNDYICYITARRRAEQERPQFFAYVFQLENQFAADYIFTEITRACHLILEQMQARRASQLVAAEPSNRSSTSASRKQQREPTAVDKAMIRDFDLLRQLAQAREKRPKRHFPDTGVKDENGDGLYRKCCRRTGKCVCRPDGSNSRSKSTPANTAAVPLHVVDFPEPSH